jgi:hypothetical protein
VISPDFPFRKLFTADDLLRLKMAGISAEQADLQIRRLKEGATHPRLLRPCELGDGIAPLPADTLEFEEEFRKACAEGRLIHFIPASGAATRMGLTDLPKALVPFHRYGSRIATPVEEHIREAAALAGPGIEVRLHFTIAPEHEILFKRHVRETLDFLRGEGIRAEIAFSLQDRSTQTLSLNEEGLPFHDATGNLLLRPGGHGAVLPNMEKCGAEFAWIRNVDNIAVESHRAKGRGVHRTLAGKLIQLARERGAGSRPLRVCGMVPNTGEPGGSPFWVSDSNGGESIRIVESTEVNSSDPEQAGIFRAATHFNPVDMICALRDPAGKRYPLAEFSDSEACLITRKIHEDRKLSGLEWPGLWNGGMARWDTVCVEIPLSLFTPVKTLEDLQRPEHQGEYTRSKD